MDSRVSTNKISNRARKGDKERDMSARSNVLDLQDVNFWKEEISHDRAQAIIEMTELERFTLMRLKVSELMTYFKLEDFCTITAICARICLHARASKQEVIEELARVAGLLAMDKDMHKLEYAIEALKGHVHTQFQAKFGNIWSKEDPGFEPNREEENSHDVKMKP